MSYVPTQRERDLEQLLEQADAKTQQLAGENRKLVDENSRLSAELRRATKLLADTAMARGEDATTHEHPTNGHAPAE